MTTPEWPPQFTLDQERILKLLTGDRFYSNQSAALREAVLNAVDAVQRRAGEETDFVPQIKVEFDRDECSFSVVDNGVGMSRDDIVGLFVKVGASAANAEANRRSVGEFGIGVVSYFMAGDNFSLETFDGQTEPTALGFNRDMLAGGPAREMSSSRSERGTKLTIKLRDKQVFDLLLGQFPHWCRDVDGLTGVLLPENKALRQGGARRSSEPVNLPTPEWVERAHLSPVANPVGWETMTGSSNIAVLYRGVFVQEFPARGIWGIEGSIDVDPKDFKPRLNREGFIGNEFGQEVEGFLREIHPYILEAMARQLSDAVDRGDLHKWDANRWASLWLSVPRDKKYERAVELWDRIFRELPAFQLAVGNSWESVSLERLTTLSGDVYLAPLEKPNDHVWAALRLLRNTGANVIRGIGRDRSWMRHAARAFGTTADLITAVFSDELPPLKPIEPIAGEILDKIGRIAPLFTGPPAVDLVQFGDESPPALRLSKKLVINIDNSAGASMVRDALEENAGPFSLVGICARHSHEHLGQVAAAVRGAPVEVLSPIRRRYILKLLT